MLRVAGIIIPVSLICQMVQSSFVCTTISPGSLDILEQKNLDRDHHSNSQMGKVLKPHLESTAGQEAHHMYDTLPLKVLCNMGEKRRAFIPYSICRNRSHTQAVLTTLDSCFPQPKPSIQSAWSENPGVDKLNRDPATPPREASSPTSLTVPIRPASGGLGRKGGCDRPWSQHPVQERSQQLGERL